MNYDFAEKETYRQLVWAAVDQCLLKPRRLRVVAYLDTKQGLETRHLLRLGYDPLKLHPVNMNPAEIAHLNMGLSADGLPRVEGHGVVFSKAVERIRDKVDVVNFDGVSQLHHRIVGEMSHAIETLRPSVFAMTVLAGREFGSFSKAIKTLASRYEKTGALSKTSCDQETRATHQARLRLLLSLIMRKWDGAMPTKRCLAHISKVKWDVYVSTSNQPMLWFVSAIAPHTDAFVKQISRGQVLPAGNHWIPACVKREHLDSFVDTHKSQYAHAHRCRAGVAVTGL